MFLCPSWIHTDFLVKVQPDQNVHSGYSVGFLPVSSQQSTIKRCLYGCHRLEHFLSACIGDYGCILEFLWDSIRPRHGVKQLCKFLCHWLTSCSIHPVVDLRRCCFWARDLARWQMLNCFRCFSDSWEIIKQYIALNVWQTLDDIDISSWWAIERSVHRFKIASLSVRSVLPYALRSGVVPELFEP